MDVIIRETKIADFESIKNILEESELLQPDFSRQRLEKMLNGKGNCSCVAILDKKIVGTAFAFSDGAFIGYLRKLAVEKDSRRKNIATLLVKKILEKFHAEKIQKIFVHIEKDNDPSLKLFDSFGFRIAKNHYLVDKSLV